jgi:hypothetical protein
MYQTHQMPTQKAVEILTLHAQDLIPELDADLINALRLAIHALYHIQLNHNGAFPSMQLPELPCIPVPTAKPTLPAT